MLRVANLRKTFGHKVAVQDLSFEVRGGEIIGLLGPNGAGKSTSLLCMAGLLRPDAGVFTWNDRHLQADRGRTIALIPETPDVFTLLTVWEHLVFVAKSCKLAQGWETRAEALLERFGLSDQRDTLGPALSKGMRQKTLICATLLADAPVFLFDEPTIGLDPAGQRELRETLLELRTEGKALVVSTHMLDVAETLSDRVVILKRGHKMFFGPLDELRSSDGSAADLESLFLRLTT